MSSASNGLAFVCIVGLLGCNPTTKPARTTSDDESNTVLATAEVVVQDVSALEQAAAELKLSSSGQVSEINLRDVDVTDDLAAAISKLSSCTKLTINLSSMTIDGWKQLGQLSNLQQLDLRNCPVGNAQLAAAVAGMPKLRALRLNGKSGVTTVNDDGLVVLAGCPDLKALALDHLWVSEQGLKHLKGNRRLAELYLAGTLVEDEGMELLAAMPSIRKLRLAQTTLTVVGLEKLSAVPLLELDISECSQVFDDAMVPVGKIKSLQRLNLWRNAVSDEGVARLAGLTKLKWLNLDNTQLSDDGLGYLQGMTGLTFMHLGSTRVSDAGMPQLLPLSLLKDLRVTRTGVTEAGVKVITDGIPGIQVQLKYVEVK